MPHDDDCAQFIQHLGAQIHRYDLEAEHLQRVQGIIAVGMIKAQRLAQALAAEIEHMKSHLAGLTPHGLEPLPPS